MQPMNPRPFDTLTTHTGIAFQEFRSAPLDIRLAVRAMCEIDILCEHIVRSELPGMMSRKDFDAKREALFQAEPALRTMRDVHDTHKHGPLGRADATVKSGRPSKFQWSGGGGALGFGALGSGAIGQVPTVHLVIETQSAAPMAITVAEQAFNFLTDEMTKRGLFPK